MGGRTGEAHSQPRAFASVDTLYRLIIKLHDEAGHLVAHFLLPYEFIVKANGNKAPAQQQGLRPGFNLPSATVLEPISPESPAPTQRSQLNSSHMDPFLRRISPTDGPTSGGMIITILGINFPPPTQQIVFVKFGNLAVPTV